MVVYYDVHPCILRPVDRLVYAFENIFTDHVIRRCTHMCLKIHRETHGIKSKISDILEILLQIEIRTDFTLVLMKQPVGEIDSTSERTLRDDFPLNRCSLYRNLRHLEYGRPAYGIGNFCSNGLLIAVYILYVYSEAVFKCHRRQDEDEVRSLVRVQNRAVAIQGHGLQRIALHLHCWSCPVLIFRSGTVGIDKDVCLSSYILVVIACDGDCLDCAISL